MLLDEEPDERSKEAGQAYVNQWAAATKDNPPTARAVRLHKLMAKYDLDVEMAVNNLRSSIHDGPLDAKTLELLYVVGYAARGFDPENIAAHTRSALRAGATPAEILHAIEQLLMFDGVISFMRALDAWADVTGAEGIEPTNV